MLRENTVRLPAASPVDPPMAKSGKWQVREKMDRVTTRERKVGSKYLQMAWYL